MLEYPKINTIFKRDMSVKGAPVIIGQYSMPEFEYLAGNTWVFTEKVDGTNVRVYYDKSGGMRFMGRSDNAQMPTFLLKKLQDMFVSEAFVEQFGDAADTTVLYGEGYGAKIQKGGGNYIRDGVGFVLFDVQVGEWWLKREDVEDVAAHLGLDVVPIVGKGNFDGAIKLCRDGFKSTWGDFLAEGLVLRPEVELRTRAGHRIITKLKTKDFARVG